MISSFCAYEVGRKRKGSKESWPGHGREESYSKFLQSRVQRAKLNPHRKERSSFFGALAWRLARRDQALRMSASCCLKTATSAAGGLALNIQIARSGLSRVPSVASQVPSVHQRLLMESHGTEQSQRAHCSGWGPVGRAAQFRFVADIVVQHRSTADVFQIDISLFSAFSCLLLTHTEFACFLCWQTTEEHL